MSATLKSEVHVIYAGGTIGQIQSPQGLIPGPSNEIEDWLRGELLHAGLDSDVSFSTIEPPIDSVNATPREWQRMAEEVRRLPSSIDGCVILHGTDTMAYATSALSIALADVPFPVLCTGSQLPYREEGSDASANVVGAFKMITTAKLSGVGLFFANTLLPGDHVTKRSSFAFDAYESPLGRPCAMIVDDAIVIESSRMNDVAVGLRRKGDSNDSPEFRTMDIAMVDLIPGISAARLRSALTPLPDAAIVRGYGAGAGPSEEPGLLEVIRQTVDAGCPVVMVSHTRQARIELDLYAAGRVFLDAGVLGAGTMTLEMIVAELTWHLSKGCRGAELRQQLALDIDNYGYR